MMIILSFHISFISLESYIPSIDHKKSGYFTYSNTSRNTYCVGPAEVNSIKGNGDLTKT